jgi:hypothetical protein
LVPDIKGAKENIWTEEDEGIGGERKLHNKEHHNLQYFPKYNQNDEVKEDEVGRACSTHREKRNACMILVGKPEETTSKT